MIVSREDAEPARRIPGRGAGTAGLAGSGFGVGRSTARGFGLAAGGVLVAALEAGFEGRLAVLEGDACALARADFFARLLEALTLELTTPIQLCLGERRLNSNDAFHLTIPDGPCQRSQVP